MKKRQKLLNSDLYKRMTISLILRCMKTRMKFLQKQDNLIDSKTRMGLI